MEAVAMANIYIQRNHCFTEEKLKLKIDEIMENIKEEMDFQSEWVSPQEFSFKRKGAKGRIEFDKDNLEFHLNLGMMFRMMKNKIENKVVESLDKHLN